MSPGLAPTHRPEVLVPGDAADDARLAELRGDPTLRVVDELAAMRRELARLRPVVGRDLVDEPARWVHYPWRHAVVHVLGPESFRRLRLDRNRNKITVQEQSRFAALRIGVVGLSVGHAIAHALALEGLAGELRLADFDEIELSNLNRVPASLLDLGTNKAVVAARRIAELDPYLDVVVEQEGISTANVGPFLDGLDLVVEECDSLDVKLLVREHARRRRVPVLMETSDRGLLDVERFDLEPERALFHGLIDDLDSERLAGLSTRDKAPYVLRMLDPEQLSARLAASMTEIDRTVTTWPQLGGDVALGAASIAAAVRRFGRGDELPSGRVRIDLDELVGRLERPEPVEGPEQPVPELAPPPADPLGLVADAANRAPSGGNTQPWAFDGDDRALRFRLLPERTSGMGVGFRGSLVTLGAAALNARVAAASIGRLGPLHVVDEVDPDQPVAVLELAEGRDDDLAALLPAVYTRATNRHPSHDTTLEAEVLASLQAHAEREGGTVRWITGAERLADCADVIAEADRIRSLTPTLHSQMMAELRRPDRDPLESGIDVRTLELDAADRAKLAVGRRADVMAQLAEWDAGHALGDGSRFLVSASAALLVVTVEGATPAHYLRGGAAVERLWLAAELAGVALHPMSPVFLYAEGDEDLRELVEPHHHHAVADLSARFRQLTDVADGEHLVLVLRAGRAPEPTVRSARLPLWRALRRHHVPRTGDRPRPTHLAH